MASLQALWPMAAQGITVFPLPDESDEEGCAPADKQKVAGGAALGDTQSRSVHARAHAAARREVAGSEAERGAGGDASAAAAHGNGCAAEVAGGRGAAGALARVSTDEELITITEAGTGKEYKVQKARAGTGRSLRVSQGAPCTTVLDGQELRAVAPVAPVHCAPCALPRCSLLVAHLRQPVDVLFAQALS